MMTRQGFSHLLSLERRLAHTFHTFFTLLFIFIPTMFRCERRHLHFLIRGASRFAHVRAFFFVFVVVAGLLLGARACAASLLASNSGLGVQHSSDLYDKWKERDCELVGCKGERERAERESRERDLVEVERLLETERQRFQQRC